MHMTLHERYTAVLSRQSRGWSIIESFRQMALAGMLHATIVVGQRHRAYVASMLSTGQLRNLTVSNTQADAERVAELLNEGMTKRTLADATRSVHAASLVFAHAILDDVVTS